MQIVNFDGYSQNKRFYSGSACRKIGIVYHGDNYILKFPGNLKDRNLKNVVLSYSNSPICEYIGSHIYDIIGIPVHETLLGTRNGKIVVACKDFLKDEEKLAEFGTIQVTFETDTTDSNGHYTNGNTTDLKEVLSTVKNHPILKDIPEIESHFWNMFVVDALIGNADRNNYNWGIITDMSGEYIRIAPVFDNGNCLSDKWDENRMLRTLTNPEQLKTDATAGRTCIFEMHGKAINPFQYMEKMNDEQCMKAVMRIVPKINLDQINNMIKEIPCISAVQKDFYCTLLRTRYDLGLQPIYKSIMNKVNEQKN